MEFNEYQIEAIKTLKVMKDFDHNDPIHFQNLLARITLGVAGEAGEISEKIKKLMRNDMELNEEVVEALEKEVGDVLWYLATLTHLIGSNLNLIARKNIEKLQDRAKRNKLSGSGDNR